MREMSVSEQRYNATKKRKTCKMRFPMRSALNVVVDVIDLIDVAGDVPRPVLDAVPVGIGNVGGSTLSGWGRRALGHRATTRPKSFNERVTFLFPHVHREMDMSSRLATGEADLCLPQADPGAVAGH